MKKLLAKKLLASIIAVVTMLSLLNPIAVMAETTPTPTPVEKTSGGGQIAQKDGWKGSGKKQQYIVKGVPVSGWKNIKGKRYYFDAKKSNYMVTGWKTITTKGKKRHFYFEPKGGVGKRGAMVTGWKKISTSTYYFKKTGSAGIKGGLFCGGLEKVGKNTYYFEKKGKLGKGLGKLHTGWKKEGGKLYNFQKSGALGVKGRMFKGTHKEGGKTFTYDKNGVLVNTVMSVPVEYQWSYRGTSFGNTTISAAGCGVVSTTMALRFMTGKQIAVGTMRDIANPYFDPKDASVNGKLYQGFFNVAAKKYGKKAKTTTKASEALDAVKKGQPVLSFQRAPSIFTGRGHFIVLRAANNKNQVRVNDPNDSGKKRHNHRTFDFYSQIDKANVRYVIFSN